MNWEEGKNKSFGNYERVNRNVNMFVVATEVVARYALCVGFRGGNKYWRRIN